MGLNGSFYFGLVWWRVNVLLLQTPYALIRDRNPETSISKFEKTKNKLSTHLSKKFYRQLPKLSSHRLHKQNIKLLSFISCYIPIQSLEFIRFLWNSFFHFRSNLPSPLICNSSNFSFLPHYLFFTSLSLLFLLT